jgi:hypothetical protein
MLETLTPSTEAVRRILPKKAYNFRAASRNGTGYIKGNEEQDCQQVFSK